MDIKIAANKTLEVLNTLDWPNELVVIKNNHRPAAEYEHVKWMLEGIVMGYIQHEKAHRWLSWAQGVIYCNQLSVDLDTFKNINKEA